MSNENKSAADLAQRVADLEAERDELLVAMHGIGKALGIPEGERSPYSITCGTLERFNKLAEIEAQEPVAWLPYWGTGQMKPHPYAFVDKAGAELIASQIKSNTEVRPLFAHPVPAQAAR